MYPPINLPIYVSFIHPSIYPSMHLFIYPSVHPSFRLSIHPSIHASNHLSICPSIHPSVYPSIHLSTCIYILTRHYHHQPCLSSWYSVSLFHNGIDREGRSPGSWGHVIPSSETLPGTQWEFTTHKQHQVRRNPGPPMPVPHHAIFSVEPCPCPAGVPSASMRRTCQRPGRTPPQRLGGRQESPLCSPQWRPAREKLPLLLLQGSG